MSRQVQDAYIVAATRTPIGKAPKGMFRHHRPDDLLVHAIRGALAQVPSLDPATIEDAIVGCAIPEAEQGLNMARIAVLLAGLPVSVGGVTVNRFCASGLTALALRASRHANGVSQRHGQVARGMWQPLFPGRAVEGVPIDHVTNGVHVPTWLQGPMRELLDRHLGPGWLARADRAETWAPVNDIPGAEIWAARCAARRHLVGMITRRAMGDRLRRGEPLDYASAAGDGFDNGRLTIGFARRLATYKRLHLVALAPERAVALVGGERPVQFVFAGKAHPADHEAKEVVRRLFALKAAPGVSGRTAFLEDYDIALAGQLVAGCDLWVNLPRPPLEASGTSGMKSVLGGGLQLSVLDGWWAEAYDGSNGWAIDGRVDADHQAQDLRDANTLFELLERQVVPMFHERDAAGIPQRWVAMIRRSLVTNGPRFSATRMLCEYADRIYCNG